MTAVAVREPVTLVPVSDRSPLDCPSCHGPMVRDIGPLSDPDVDGVPIIDELDVCLCCGYEAPVLLIDGMSLDEIRDRVRRVVAHRRVRDHSRCDEYQPCRVERPGIPSVPVEAVKP